MTENYIQLEKSNVLKLGIKTAEGKDTGNFLEFNLEDVELPLKYQEMIEKSKKNEEWIQHQFIIIDKRQDVNGKKLLSKNEEDKIKALNEFFKRETETYNIFLGENGVQKLLNGEKLGWTSLQQIDNYIDKQIMPYLDVDMDRFINKLKTKYNEALKQENEVLK